MAEKMTRREWLDQYVLFLTNLKIPRYLPSELGELCRALTLQLLKCRTDQEKQEWAELLLHTLVKGE